jgi:hypothetical protein
MSRVLDALPDGSSTRLLCVETVPLAGWSSGALQARGSPSLPLLLK